MDRAQRNIYLDENTKRSSSEKRVIIPEKTTLKTKHSTTPHFMGAYPTVLIPKSAFSELGSASENGRRRLKEFRQKSSKLPAHDWKTTADNLQQQYPFLRYIIHRNRIFRLISRNSERSCWPLNCVPHSCACSDRSWKKT